MLTGQSAGAFERRTCLDLEAEGSSTRAQKTLPRSLERYEMTITVLWNLKPLVQLGIDYDQQSAKSRRELYGQYSAWSARVQLPIGVVCARSLVV